MDGGQRMIEVQAQDYTTRLRTTIANRAYVSGNSDQFVVKDIFKTYRPDFDTANVQQIVASMPAISFPVHSLEQFMQRIVKVTRGVYRVDYYKRLFYGAIGQIVAPFNLSDLGTSYAADTLARSPQGYWRLNDTGATAADLSGNGNTGTLNGTITKSVAGATSDGDTAMTFDGATGYIGVADAAGLHPATITVEAWIYPTANQVGNFVNKDGNSEYRARINALKVEFLDRGGTNLVVSATTLSLNTWYHVVCVGSSSGLRIYINGKLDASNAVAFGGGGGTTQLQIGANTGFGEYFPGRIDEVAIYNYALTADQVAVRYSMRAATALGTTFGYENAKYSPDVTSLADKVWVVGHSFLSQQQSYTVPAALVNGSAFQFPLPGSATKADIISVTVGGVGQTIGQAPGDGDITTPNTFKFQCLVQPSPAIMAFQTPPLNGTAVVVTGKFRYPLIQTYADPSLVAQAGGLIFEAVVRDKRIRDLALAQTVAKAFLQNQGLAMKGMTTTIMRRGLGSSLIQPSQIINVTGASLFTGLGGPTLSFLITRVRLVLDAESDLDNPYRVELEMVDRPIHGGY
jgi:hypothetical protein